MLAHVGYLLPFFDTKYSTVKPTTKIEQKTFVQNIAMRYVLCYIVLDTLGKTGKDLEQGFIGKKEKERSS